MLARLRAAPAGRITLIKLAQATTAATILARDPATFRALLPSGAPVRMEVVLDAPTRRHLFTAGTPLSRWLATLHPEWESGTVWGNEPVSHDVALVAWLLRPQVCRPQPLDIVVSPDGVTKVGTGAADDGVCLDIDRGAMLSLLQARVAAAR